MFGSNQYSSMMPYMQMFQGGQNPFATPMGGLPPQTNMAPQIPVAPKPQGGMMQLPQPQQPQQGMPGGALGGAVKTGDNISQLYGMGNNAYKGLFGQSPPAGQSPGTSFTGGSNISGQQNAQNFTGGQSGDPGLYQGMAQGGPANFSGYGMAGPSSGGMYGGQAGANSSFVNGGQPAATASFMNGGTMFGGSGASGAGGGMFGAGGPTGMASTGEQAAAGAGMFGGSGAATGSSTSPSWLQQLWEWL